MEFKLPYLQAMQEQAPKMMRELRQAGQMDEHLHQKSEQAHQMLNDLMAGEPKHPNGGTWKNLAKRQQSEEVVRATLIEFQPEGRQAPDPLGKISPV